MLRVAHRNHNNPHNHNNNGGFRLASTFNRQCLAVYGLPERAFKVHSRLRSRPRRANMFLPGWLVGV